MSVVHVCQLVSDPWSKVAQSYIGCTMQCYMYFQFTSYGRPSENSNCHCVKSGPIQ